MNPPQAKSRKFNRKLMNLCQAKSRKSNRKLMNPCQGKSRKSKGSVEFLPEELIAQILSYLRVKSLMQLRCVCKAWNTLISHPNFIKLHLQQSKQNIQQILCRSQDFSISPSPLNTLLNNPSIIKSTQNYFPSNPCYLYQFIGSCNGLFCFFLIERKRPDNNWFQLWNPATNILSNKYGHHTCDDLRISRFSFGYDNSTDTYITVYFDFHQLEIYSSGSNVRKIIQLRGMSAVFHWDSVPFKDKCCTYAVYLNGTIILLARYMDKQILIISLNLGTLTYTELPLPRDFVATSRRLPLHLPTIHVLEDHLYFSHHTQKTHFIIWKMMEFGIENSWTQFLKISYMDLDYHMEHKHFLAPLCLYDGGIALVQGGKNVRLQVIVYNWSENRIQKTKIHKRMKWIFNQNYVESMVPPP